MSAAPKSPGGGLEPPSFPSLASGIDGLKDLEHSLNKFVNEASATHASNSIYNSRFQFFNSKRTSCPPPDTSTDVAEREDSLVKAWKTVSEIDALLGSDFRPSMPTCDEEPSASVTVDDTYVRRLNSELEAALNVSLTFKERLRDTQRGGRGVFIGNERGFVGSSNASADYSAASGLRDNSYTPDQEMPLSRAVLTRHLGAAALGPASSGFSITSGAGLSGPSGVYSAASFASSSATGTPSALSTPHQPRARHQT